MSDDDVHTVIPFAPPERGGGDGTGDGNGSISFTGEEPPLPEKKPRVRKLRLLLLLAGLGVLGLVSAAFGMMMAVTSDLPQIENRAQYRAEKPSVLYDDQGKEIGVLTPPNNVVLDQFDQIAPVMRQAIVSVEDKRFWHNDGIDIRGLARAVVNDVTGGATQGASTIEEQFVKQALNETDNRTIFEKLREAAMAFQLAHHWPKQKILTQYLNTIYFGNGAYGVESAARTYFGKQLGYNPTYPNEGRCGDTPLPPCAKELLPYQAALLAGMVSDPTGYDPILYRSAALARRQIVLRDMVQQHYISLGQYESANAKPLPTQSDLQQAPEPPAAPYFIDWVTPQIIHALDPTNQSIGEYRAYYGGLKIHTTIDLQMQQAAENVVNEELPSGEGLPSASLVAIDNQTGEVKAMVGGPSYQSNPFNLAVDGFRQPGSAFKPFTLQTAFEHGISPDSTWTSAPADFIVPNSAGKEHFYVHNFDNEYSGDLTLAQATAVSDNSVFTRVGIEGLGPKGTTWIAANAKADGIRTPVSTNLAMIIGGLKVGVSSLDMAHAYESFATGGLRVYNTTLGDVNNGPIGIHAIDCDGCAAHIGDLVNHPQYQRVMPQSIANEVSQTLTGVVQDGTGTQAAIPGVFVTGKTGTTTNYADAWFVGWTPQMTVAVWVGYPNKLVPMLTQWNGGPVEGGDFPAVIWHNFMVQALQIMQQENPKSQNTSTTSSEDLTPEGNTGAAPSTTASPTTGAGTTATPQNQGQGQNPPANKAPTAPAGGGTGGNTGGGTGGNTGGGTGGGTGGAPTGGTGGAGIGTK